MESLHDILCIFVTIVNVFNMRTGHLYPIRITENTREVLAEVAFSPPHWSTLLR